MSPKQQPSPHPHVRLLEAFHSTTDDLGANRLGTLGPQQVARLRRSANWNLAGGIVLAGGLGGLVLAVASRPLKVVQTLLIVLLVGVMLALGIVMFVRLRQAAGRAVVERVSGPVRVVRRGRAGFYLVVEGRDFKLPVLPNMVTNGGMYHVYVTPAAKRIVSMEPVAPVQ
ncbi:MAG: hypothetical protein JWM34_2650 [Ilumatobacteraceae bacterium]|nr:hypothetical protein [Ilumatobacteraceae bacterium]